MKKQILIFPPRHLRGTVLLPASKSISNRALVINALATRANAGSAAELHHVSDCDDTEVMQRWLSEWPATIDVGAAGTAMRFSTALLSVSDGCHVITGSERMKHRPIAVLVDALRALGASVEYMEEEGFPPLRIVGQGQLAGGHLALPGHVSSQYVSALLLIGPVMKQGLRLTLTGKIVSRPYIDLTVRLMRDFGAEVRWVTDHELEVAPKPYQSREYFVESDWSAASYWYEMLALSGHQDASIELPGLFEMSSQGDAQVAEIFAPLGVHTAFLPDNRVVLTKSDAVCTRFDYDFVNQPDLAQTSVVTCCLLDIPFHFYGLESLKIKETDRLEALHVELRKLGYEIQEVDGCELQWAGQRVAPASDIVIDTYDDHRMAMAFAPAAMKLGQLAMNHPQVVSKSYPRYWNDLRSVGFDIHENPSAV